MKMKRSTFISQVSIAAAAITVRPMHAAASITGTTVKSSSAGEQITLFHTNDLQGEIGRAAGPAGLKTVKSVLRSKHAPGLLFDGGNFLDPHAAPGEHLKMIALMNTMGYRAATVGGNELADGQDALAAMIPSMGFKLVNCNYRFGPALSGKISPYITFWQGSIKIGVTGVGNKVPGVGYADPISCLDKIAAHLNNQIPGNIVRQVVSCLISLSTQIILLKDFICS